MSHLKSAALAAGLLGFCLQSHAVVPPVAQASIDWTSFSYQLFDLDPLDGVEASLSWLYQASGISLEYVSSSYWSSSEGWTPALQSSDGVSEATADASSLTALAYGYAPSESHVGTYVHRWGGFTLSAKTLAVFSVSSSVSVVPDSNFYTYGYATAYLSVDDYNSDPYYSSSSALTVTDYDGLPNKSGTLSANFVNLTDSERSGSLGASVQVQVTAAVPEPHTYGMLLAGLAVIFQVARRRCTD